MASDNGTCRETGMKKGNASDKWGILRRVLIIVLIGVIIYEAYEIYAEEHERNVAVQEYDAIEEEAVTDNGSEPADGTQDSSAGSSSSSKEGDNYPVLTVDYDLLEETNEDFVGWLYWKFDVSDDKHDFLISYPVVKEQSVDQYLHKTFTGEINSSGCIFMDVDSDSDLNGYSDFLFGHNMRNGKMFGSMDSIYRTSDKAAMQSTPQYIYMYTRKAIYQYVMYEYEQTNSGNDTVYAVLKNDSAYDAYVKRLQKLNNYDCPIEVSFDDRPELLNLSTCSGSAGTSKRLVVHCVRVGSFENKE